MELTVTKNMVFTAIQAEATKASQQRNLIFKHTDAAGQTDTLAINATYLSDAAVEKIVRGASVSSNYSWSFS